MKGDIVLFTPFCCDEVEGDYNNECNDCIREERCKRISVSSINSNVSNKRATYKAAEGDAYRFRLNFKLHVGGEVGNNPCNSINMLKHNQTLEIKILIEL
jgi:hypothetical protein